MAPSEEGHVFDHEPGMFDYHHDDPQFELHEDLEDSEAHYYADHEARYPVFLEQVAHDWEQKKRQPKPRVYDEFEEY